MSLPRRWCLRCHVSNKDNPFYKRKARGKIQHLSICMWCFRLEQRERAEKHRKTNRKSYIASQNRYKDKPGYNRIKARGMRRYRLINNQEVNRRKREYYHTVTKFYRPVKAKVSRLSNPKYIPFYRKRQTQNNDKLFQSKNVPSLREAMHVEFL